MPKLAKRALMDNAPPSFPSFQYLNCNKQPVDTTALAEQLMG
jgi:hypothetical protein